MKKYLLFIALCFISSISFAQRKQATDEYSKNAVEAIPSIFRRKYGLDNIRTSNWQRVRSIFFGICLAYNGQKHQKFLKEMEILQRY